jgi:hypothetical protein
MKERISAIGAGLWSVGTNVENRMEGVNCISEFLGEKLLCAVYMTVAKVPVTLKAVDCECNQFNEWFFDNCERQFALLFRNLPGHSSYLVAPFAFRFCPN